MQQQTTTSSASNSNKVRAGSIRVLPMPVQLQEPQHHQSHKDHVDSINSTEADHFIEQLMKEAETDPKLRELTYGNDNKGHHHQERTYRAAQDMIIKEISEDQARSQSRPSRQPNMPERPYRTNEDMQIISKRSQSADGRLHQNGFRKQDPKLGSFRDASTGRNSSNATESLLNEVVTDKEHHSVRDLVNMMENNIKSESLNPYVRKWGCDLISPEPHKKNVTYRREKKQIVDQNELSTFKTYTWQEDDHFQKKAKIDRNENMIRSHFEANQSPSGRDDTDYLEEHTTDLDELVGRSMEDVAKTTVVWPPPSPMMQERYPTPPLFSPSPPPPMMAIPLPPRTPSPLPLISVEPPPPPPPLEEMTPKKSNLKKRSQSEGGRGSSRRFSNSSLHEIDQQIVMIQNEFEAELDTLIDAYRNVQQTSRKGLEFTQQQSNHQMQSNSKSERSRSRGKHLKTNSAQLSDDEGTYQALSVVFEDKSKGPFSLKN